MVSLKFSDSPCQEIFRSADKNVVGLQVGVSSTEKVCPARLTWSSSVRDDVLGQKDDDGVVTGVIPD